jgi:hypothetical protein
MKKQKLIQAVEKARTQTRGQAARVIDMLCGVESDPFAKKDRENRKIRKGLPSEINADFEGKLEKR